VGSTWTKILQHKDEKIHQNHDSLSSFFKTEVPLLDNKAQSEKVQVAGEDGGNEEAPPAHCQSSDKRLSNHKKSLGIETHSFFFKKRCPFM